MAFETCETPHRGRMMILGAGKKNCSMCSGKVDLQHISPKYQDCMRGGGGGGEGGQSLKI